jgi:hypothetical protein
MAIIKKYLWDKNLVVIASILFIFIVGCTSKLNRKKRNNMFSKNDSLLLIKDTIIYGKSAEGEEMKLYKNNYSLDSVIILNAYGENGKAIYRFIFNKNLINSERITYKYQTSIHQDSKAEINDIIKEDLNSSKKIRDELTDIFKDCHSIFVHKIGKDIFEKWNGVYKFSLNTFKTNEYHSFVLNIQVKNDHSKLIFSIDGMKTDTIVKGTIKDNEYVITYNKDNQNKEYIIKKEEDNYFITGLSIYMLNPPNEVYDLEKIK